ncbi:hypothetical protein GCM10009577_13330 [Streptomyces javensis]
MPRTGAGPLPLHLRHTHPRRERTRTRAMAEPVAVHLASADEHGSRFFKFYGRAPSHLVHNRDHREARGAPRKHRSPSVP